MKYWLMSFWYPRLEKWTLRSIPIEVIKPLEEFLRKNWNPDMTWTCAKRLAREILKVPDIAREIEDAIAELGGKAFVRTDICAPKDVFLNPLRAEREGVKPYATSPEEVIAFLLCSERTMMLHYTVEKEPIRRIWLRQVITPLTEVRVFIKDYKPVAVSQYRYKEYDRDLDDDMRRTLYVVSVLDLIDEMELREKGFPPNLVLDFCQIKPLGAFLGRLGVCLIEVNPWSRDTDPCLFNWDDLEKMKPDDRVVIRVNTLQVREDVLGHERSELLLGG